MTSRKYTFYHFADGYTDGNGASYVHYCIKDYQGNNRVVAKYDGTIEQTTHYYPYGGTLTHSTNQGVQKYKYNGKEFDRTHGLDWYDYCARQYDPASGRFTSMDPLCEKYYNISPYSYCHANPIMRIDPDGRDDIFNSNGQFITRTNDGSAVIIMDNNGYKKLLSDFSYNSASNLSMLKNVTSHYASLCDEAPFEIQIKNVTKAGATLGYNTANDTYDVTLVNGKINATLNNMYNFENSMFHERIHRSQPETRNKTTGEVETILAETMHSSFAGTDSNYKQSACSYAQISLQEAINNGVITLSDAQRYIDKLNNSSLGDTCFFKINNNIVETNYMIPCLTILPNQR